MTIKDELFGDYEIHYDDLSYKVCKVKTAEESGKDYLKTVGYYSSVANAVSKIARLLLDDSGKQYSLKEYYELLKSTHEKLLNKLNSI